MNVWDMAQVLTRLVEGESEETIGRMAGRVVEYFPEKAPSILKALRKVKKLDNSYITVIMAEKSSQEKENGLKRFIQESFGETSKVNFEVDPAIIGGIIIKKGELVIDNSIRNRIDQVTKNLSV